ncbi:hypothetical protein BFS06_13765 [Clostridium perfringens]|uniref:Uncharacterized protein n=1 Tax=Clostridium perfringens TaxID=1502 RepID=A0A140GRR9_CLOPF|nr:hypothetical protein [Clostridium perfringens]AMN31228.1 hypothetical protein JFP838_pA0312 [Clostridium perfringens]TBX14272.1 hypothetical protein BFS06_13765 [Clostridium perfringens]
MDKLIFEYNDKRENEFYFFSELTSNIKEKNKLKKKIQDNIGFLYLIHNDMKIALGIDIDLNIFSYDKKYDYLLKDENKLTTLRANTTYKFLLSINKDKDYYEELFFRSCLDNFNNTSILSIAITLNILAWNRFVIREQRFPDFDELNFELFKIYDDAYINDIRIKDMLFRGVKSLDSGYTFVYMEYDGVSKKYFKEKDNEILINCKAKMSEDYGIFDFLVNKQEMILVQKGLKTINPNYKKSKLILCGLCKKEVIDGWVYKKLVTFNLFNVSELGLYIRNQKERELFRISNCRNMLFIRPLEPIKEYGGFIPSGIYLDRIHGKIGYIEGEEEEEVKKKKYDLYNRYLRDTHLLIDESSCFK